MNGRSVFVTLGAHEIHVSEWGDPANPALVMWHGLARTGRDFDELARALSDRYFVICPDTIGRGLSGWSDAPNTDYGPSAYARTALAMLDHYGIAQTAWIGTSLGGLVGIHLAAGTDRLTGLILNDIGPEIPADAVARIMEYAGTLPEFTSVSDALDWLRAVYTPFGPAPDTFWHRMAETSIRRRDDGRLTLHYDPKIIAAFPHFADEMVTWDALARITLPVHVLRGVNSDILTSDIAERMRGLPCVQSITAIDGCGHAPSLSRPGDARLIATLLESFPRRATPA